LLSRENAGLNYAIQVQLVLINYKEASMIQAAEKQRSFGEVFHWKGATILAQPVHQ
jgi:hypothetical protein